MSIIGMDRYTVDVVVEVHFSCFVCAMRYVRTPRIRPISRVDCVPAGLLLRSTHVGALWEPGLAGTVRSHVLRLCGMRNGLSGRCWLPARRLLEGLRQLGVFGYTGETVAHTFISSDAARVCSSICCSINTLIAVTEYVLSVRILAVHLSILIRVSVISTLLEPLMRPIALMEARGARFFFEFGQISRV